MEKLIKIQNELKVPKGNYNSFGKYKYRSCENIIEAVKPILLQYNARLTLTDKIVSIGGKLFVKSTATIFIDDQQIKSDGYAQLSEHKGMSPEQATGTASSYARKYSLNGLFLIDETEADADHENTQPVREEMITSGQITTIETLLQNSSIDENEKSKIDRTMNAYTFEKANKCIEYLQNSQVDSIEAGAGYSLTDINKKVKAIYNSSK